MEQFDGGFAYLSGTDDDYFLASFMFSRLRHVYQLQKCVVPALRIDLCKISGRGAPNSASAIGIGHHWR